MGAAKAKALPDDAKPAGAKRTQQFREALRTAGIDTSNWTTRALGLIVGATGDVDLAVTAVVMRPRPAWVRELLGPVAES